MLEEEQTQNQQNGRGGSILVVPPEVVGRPDKINRSKTAFSFHSLSIDFASLSEKVFAGSKTNVFEKVRVQAGEPSLRRCER